MSKTIRFQYSTIRGHPIVDPIITKNNFGVGDALYNMSLMISGVTREGFYYFLDKNFTIKVTDIQKQAQRNFIVRVMDDEEFALWCLRINGCIG